MLLEQPIMEAHSYSHCASQVEGGGGKNNHHESLVWRPPYHHYVIQLCRPRHIHFQVGYGGIFSHFKSQA